MPAHSDMHDKKTEAKLPPAEKLKTVTTLDEALTQLAADKKSALDSVNLCSEEDLASKDAPAPWDPRPAALGIRLLQMVDHFNQHKAQLFYYLKLQGKPVNTMHLYRK